MTSRFHGEARNFFNDRKEAVLMKKLLIPIAVCAISLTMISAGFAGLFGGKSIEGEIQDISANTLTIQEDKAADQAADQAAEEMAAPVSVEVNQDTQFEQ